eukprot:13952967-Heterocapsa_arctica.AAC.1
MGSTAGGATPNIALNDSRRDRERATGGLAGDSPPADVPPWESVGGWGRHILCAPSRSCTPRR